MDTPTLNEQQLQLFKQVFENGIPFNNYLGLQLVEIREGFAQINIPFRPELVGEVRENRMHGGVIMAAMDTAAGAASITTINLLEDKIATIDLRTDFLSPAKAEDMHITAEVRKSGARIVFVQMTAFHLSAPEIPIAEGRATFSVKRK